MNRQEATTLYVLMRYRLKRGKKRGQRLLSSCAISSTIDGLGRPDYLSEEATTLKKALLGEADSS